MSGNIQSILTVGSEGIIIDIECQLSNSLPLIVIVGLGSKAIDESKERIRSAFASSQIQLPRKRITINLAPADIPKESTGLDLAMAAAILTASGQVKKSFEHTDAIIGEVGLNGTVRSVRGIIGKIVAAQKLGLTTFFIPHGNLDQAKLIPGVKLYPVKNLRDLAKHLNDEVPLVCIEDTDISMQPEASASSHILSAIVGQDQAKRALTIAAAGGHNILLAGPPGTGKSMLAKSLPSILPSLTHHEILEITHLHSLANNKYDRLITKRPFRAPHHSSSHVSIVGGGNNARPGEITLSHRGVLFLDEIPEFSRQTIESLRQPLEDRVITVARAKQTIEYPANFIMIATANPCPCGYYGSSRQCQCSVFQILNYQRKLSGPILDRIDLFVEVDRVEHSLLLHPEEDRSQDIRAAHQVQEARIMQRDRFKSEQRLNTDMINKEIKDKAAIEHEAIDVLNQAAQKLDLSARSYMRLIKVARTIADLEKCQTIKVVHITEALQYRSLRLLTQ